MPSKLNYFIYTERRNISQNHSNRYLKIVKKRFECFKSGREVVKSTILEQNTWWSLPTTLFLNLKRWCLSCIATPLSSSKK